MGKFIVKYRKIMIGILIVLIYLAILTLVSFLRSTEIKVIGENLVNYQDFHAAGPEEGTAWIDDTGLHIRDAGTGAKVFSTEISLRDFQMIQAEFEVECPESFSGEALLHVDLFAEGYDTDEQEFAVSLHAGKNKASGIIDKGENAPDEAMLRIFCLEPVECHINGLNVKTAVEEQHGGKMICAMITAILIVMLIAIAAVRTPNAENNKCIEEKIQKINSKKADIICAILLFSGIFTVLYFFLGFWKVGLDAPSLYEGGDDFAQYAFAKLAIEGGWNWTNNALGTPYGSNYFDQTSALLQNTEFIITKILGLFTKNIVIVANLQLLLAFALCGLSAFCVLRAIGIERIFALFGGMLFGLSPYILARHIAHYCLSACYFVPLSVLLCVWSTENSNEKSQGQKDFFESKKKSL